MLQQMSCVNIKYASHFLSFARISITCIDIELRNMRAEIPSSIFIHTRIHILCVCACSICIDLCINMYSCTYVYPITKLALLLGILVTAVNWKGHLSCMNSENLLWGESLEASAHVAVQVWENNSRIFFLIRMRLNSKT